MGSLAKTLGPDKVCCLTGVRADGGTPLDDGVRVYRRPLLFAKSKAVQAVIGTITLTQIMLQERPHIVQLATVYDGYVGLWLRRWLKLPFVIYAHGNEVLGAMESNWPTLRLALQQADRVLACSQFTAELVRKAGVAAERVEVVHPGCDVDLFRPLPVRTDLRTTLLGVRQRDQVLLTVGNLVARKGHDMVIRALPLLRKRIPDVTYLIIGDGPYRTELETLALATGVQDNVIFAGRVSNEDLPDIYALGDVFVMPSRARLEACDVEGFGMVFLEAGACGKPVVGGRSGGACESIVDGVTGLLVNPHDPEDIANALARLLSDSRLALQLGQQGRMRVVRDFAWSRVTDRVQEILAAVLAEQASPSPHPAC